ncbi:uncharacterized protein LOC126893910 [Daktulosphaira vitifoliae]|uniref:uncharacterized protein LOC126893910 n=1 Tax=Daktulosphaira vitifoliae TaxID=58002 RepID=UPI0021AA513E|nr:uncharacterized protein LOC126893910 [Daktulosphaira vitifoliae]
MEFYSLILMSIAIVILKLGESECLDYRKDYINYTKKIVGYIYFHIGSNEMRYLKFKQDSHYTINIEKAFQSDTTMTNFKADYSYTISVLNYKYTEILKKFLEYVDIILHKCKQFHDNNFTENFISCVTSLAEEVKNSKTMFENLYNATKFISYIDVRFVFRSIVPNVIIDEIEFFKQYILQQISETSPFDLNSLPNLKDTEEKFKKLNEFYTEALEKVNNIFQNSNIINTSIETNSITNQIKECSNENDSYLVYLTCSKLNSFYIETIELWYKNLGFEIFLSPKIPELKPPKYREIIQNDGIKALNIFRQESGWKKMNYINIIYNNKQLNVDCMIKDEINHINFQIKKEHFLQLLRCRFTEIIKNIYVLLSAILHICYTDAMHFKYSCLVELFDSFNKSIKMFEGLNTALITLNKFLIWDDRVKSHSSLEKILKWVECFLCLLKNNDFSNDQQGKKQPEKIETLEKIFLSFRYSFYMDLNIELTNMNGRCIMTKPFYDKFKIINSLKNLVNTVNNHNLLQSTQIYLNACNLFEIFCEKVHTFFCEDLGFNKVYSLINS